MSGMLYAPGVPNAAEAAEMAKLVDTYGKTWHTWQVDRGDTLPLGEALLPVWQGCCNGSKRCDGLSLSGTPGRSIMASPCPW